MHPADRDDQSGIQGAPGAGTPGRHQEPKPDEEQPDEATPDEQPDVTSLPLGIAASEEEWRRLKQRADQPDE